jgi:urea transporter
VIFLLAAFLAGVLALIGVLLIASRKISIRHEA